MTYDTLNRQRKMHEDTELRVDNEYRGLYKTRRGFDGFPGLAPSNVWTGNAWTFINYHDAWGRVNRVLVREDSSNHFNDSRYTYDFASNITLYREDTHRAHDEHYQYDRLHRLQNFKRGQYVQSPSRQQTWQLDRLGNWTGITSQTAQQPGSPTQTRTHDNANQVETVTDTLPNPDDTISVTYDAAGNLHILPDQNDETKARRFIYDFRNRLITIEESEDYDLFEPSWELIARYHYDSFNRRLKKHLRNENDVVYLYSGWQCIEEREFDDTAQEWQPRRQFIYGGQGIDDVVIFENYDTTAQEWDRHYYSKGLNDRVLALTDANGVPVEYYLYDPYGKVTFLDGSRQPIAGRATANPYLFQSRRLDEETGLYYYRNRYYSPDLGRFMQRDPLGYVDGMNLYEFVGGRPISAVDPLGLWTRISRKGDAWASTCAEPGDTWLLLSIKVGLEFSEYQKWVKEGPELPGEPVPGEIYHVPNTVVLVRGQIGFWLWPMHVNASRHAKTLKGLGYNVIEVRRASKKDIIDSFKKEGIYALQFYGHGEDGSIYAYNRGEEWARDRRVHPTDVSVPYRLAWLYLYSCEVGHLKEQWSALVFEHGEAFVPAGYVDPYFLQENESRGKYVH